MRLLRFRFRELMAAVCDVGLQSGKMDRLPSSYSSRLYCIIPRRRRHVCTVYAEALGRVRQRSPRMRARKAQVRHTTGPELQLQALLVDCFRTGTRRRYQTDANRWRLHRSQVRRQLAADSGRQIVLTTAVRASRLGRCLTQNEKRSIDNRAHKLRKIMKHNQYTSVTTE